MRGRGAVLALAVVACATVAPPVEVTSRTQSAVTPPGSVATSTTSATPAGPSTTVAMTTVAPGPPTLGEVSEFPVPGSRPHDVAVAPDGTVWYTAQASGSLDRLDPETGDVIQVPLGVGSAPHGVIFGPDAGAWVTDQGLNALIRVDHDSLAVDVYPAEVDVGMHTPAFAPDGTLWFTGQAGYYGRFDLETESMELFETGGGGPYGITVTPSGDVYFAALAGSYVACVDPQTGEMTRLDPPTPDQGARRVWSDSSGRVWVSYWNTGHVAVYEPATDSWTEWKLPGETPQAYAVYVDEADYPWVSDFGGRHALVRFDPATETFDTVPLPAPGSAVRQILGRSGEIWGAESGADALMVVRYATP